MVCRVVGCNYPEFHNSQHHLCERCKATGHGITECLNHEAYLNLIQDPRYYEEIKDEYFCKVEYCSFPGTHSTIFHRCQNCGENHSIARCSSSISRLGDYTVQPYSYRTQLRYANDIVDSYVHDVFYDDHVNQYEDINMEENNIEEHVDIDDYIMEFGNSNFVLKKCPLCRTENKIYNYTNLKVFGVNALCAICMTKDSNIVLPDCRHACLCETCLEYL